MKKNVSLLLLLLLIVLLAGCAVTSSKNLKYTANSYAISGDLLESTRVSLRSLCDNGLATPEQCEKWRASYEDAKMKYIIAGDALIDAERMGKAVDNILNGINSEIKTIK